MNTQLKKQLSTLPDHPGVYQFYNDKGEIIYIGKATSLKKRVKSYFQKTHNDYKTPLLVNNIDSLTYTQTNSPIEALFLEAELIKRHKPLYNVREKDDKNFIFVRVNSKDEFPAVTVVRRPTDDGAKYYGPYVAVYEVKQALKYLRRVFPYYTKQARTHSSKLEYQIGVVPTPDINAQQYRANIRKLTMVLEGKSSVLVKDLEKQMRQQAKRKNYEAATELRNQLFALKGLATRVTLTSDDGFDAELDGALKELANVLNITKSLQRIECYDISNFAGGDAVSSMIVFTGGVPDQKEYRHFKMRTRGPNDFAMMHETLSRRFSARNSKWPKPDLIIIDGGKGQLTSALKAMQEQDVLSIPTVGLAKRYETIVQPTEHDYRMINFADSSKVLHLIQRIRDEAHRFAVSYHTVLRKKRTQASLLDSIEGVGPATRKQLIRQFGSVQGVKQASLAELTICVGTAKASKIYQALKAT